MLRKFILCAMALLGLSGCGSVAIRHTGESMLSFEQHAYVPASVSKALADASECCASLADLPYRNIAQEGEWEVQIGVDSPVRRFESGKSFFAAYRISELPRPLILEVSSLRTAEPGFAGLMTRTLGTESLVFYPVLLLLDDKFNVRQVLEPPEAQKGCLVGNVNPAQMTAYRISQDIEASPSDASYMVVMTKGAMLQKDGDSVCGQILHGYSPIGNLAISIASLEFNDGKMGSKSGWMWHPGKYGDGDVGLFAGFAQDPGLLVLGDDAVHYLERNEFRYVERLAIPYERMVYAKALDSGRSDSRLGVRALDDSGSRLISHVFDAAWTGPHVSATEMAGKISARMRSGAGLVEQIGIAVTTGNAAVEFLAGNSEAAERVGKSTVEAGMTTAFPCGICQTGACPPEAIVPCAALFSVGAVVGGTFAAGRELFANLAGEASKAPIVSHSTKRSLTPNVETARSKTFDRAALSNCIARQLDKSDNAEWHDQGRKALPTTLPAESMRSNGETNLSKTLLAQGYRYRAEVSISRIALVSDAKAGQAALRIPVRLLIEGQLKFSDLSRTKSWNSPLQWQSDSYPISEWSAQDRQIASRMLELGCAEVARQSIEVSRKLWTQ